MRILASAAATLVITSIASMVAAQSAALPPAASPVPPPASQPATAPASPPAWTYTPPPPAPPPQEPEFGDSGEYVISSALFASFGRLGDTKGNSSTTSLSIQPSLDYFVGKNVLIGGALYLSYSDSSVGITDTTTTAVGAYGHVGGNVAVGPTVSWRPVLSIGYRSETTKITVPSGFNYVPLTGYVPPFVFPERNDKLLIAQIFAPFLLHPVRHFFLGIGPDFFVDLVHFTGSSASENRRVFFGASSIVGGWFGGERDPSGS